MDRFTSYFEERLSFVIEHYGDKFDFKETYQLHLNYDESTAGKLVLHENKMQTPYDYMGQYFTNIPIRVEAIAEPGYVFVKWEEIDSRDAVLSFVGTEDQILTPVFLKESEILAAEDGLQWTVYPTLAADFLYVEAAYANPSKLKVEIVNSVGQIVFEENIEVYNYLEVHSFDIKDIAEGIYFLRLNTADEKSSVKFVVQR